MLTSLPIWLVLADMVYGFALNIMQSFSLSQSKVAADGLPVSPDIAFSGLQVLANGGMICIVGFGLLVLLQLNRTVLQRRLLSIGVFRTLGLIAVLAFSLPSIWQWIWALIGLASGHPVVALGNVRYLLVAVCLPLIALLCVWRLIGWYKLGCVAEAAGEFDAPPPELS